MYFRESGGQLSFWFDKLHPAKIEEKGYIPSFSNIMDQAFKDIQEGAKKVINNPGMPTPTTFIPYIQQINYPPADSDFYYTYTSDTTSDNNSTTELKAVWDSNIAQDLKGFHNITYEQPQDIVYAVRLQFSDQVLKANKIKTDQEIWNLAKMYLFGSSVFGVAGHNLSWQVYQDPKTLMTSINITSSFPMEGKLFAVSEGQELPVKVFTTNNIYELAA